MSKKRYFDTKFWSDSFVVDDLNPLDRYVFMYLMLNEKTNIAGVYELPLRTMSYELGIEKENLEKMLKRLEPKVFYENGWVVLTNAIRHQNYRNSKIAEGIRKELCKAPKDMVLLVHLPDDLNIDLTCPIDESSIPHQETSHLIESNRIESKSKLNLNNNSAKADGSKIFDKKQYAQAVQADEEQDYRAKMAKSRKGSFGSVSQSFNTKPDPKLEKLFGRKK